MKRLVTGLDAEGRSCFISSGRPPRSVEHVHTPGFRTSLVWTTPPAPARSADARRDPTIEAERIVPQHPGATSLVVLTLPPDNIYEEEGFDPAAAYAEHALVNSDVTAAMDPDAPGMHATATIDYCIVLSGRLVAELDDGRCEEMGPGDILIQNATRHAWRNPFDTPAEIAFVMIATA